MQQVAHIFSRIERSKIYQFGSFSLRSFCKSELNFASSFASKLRKFGHEKPELIAAIFPSRVTQIQLKIVQSFARSCVKILYGYWFNTRTKFVWFLLQHRNDVAAKYVTTNVHTWIKIIIIHEKIDAYFKRHFDASKGQNTWQVWFIPAPKIGAILTRFWCKWRHQFYQATAWKWSKNPQLLSELLRPKLWQKTA